MSFRTSLKNLIGRDPNAPSPRDSEEWAYICPPLAVNAPPELKDEVRRLTHERGSNSAVIYRWLENRRRGPRNA